MTEQDRVSVQAAVHAIAHMQSVPPVEGALYNCHDLIRLATSLASPEWLAVFAFQINRNFGLPVVDISYCKDVVVGGERYVEMYEYYITNMEKTYREFEETAYTQAINWPIFNALDADDLTEEVEPSIVSFEEFNRKRGERDAAASRAGKPANCA